MSKLHLRLLEDVKEIIAEFERFVFVDLKSVSLTSNLVQKKNRISGNLERLRQNWPQLKLIVENDDDDKGIIYEPLDDDTDSHPAANTELGLAVKDTNTSQSSTLSTSQPKKDIVKADLTDSKTDSATSSGNVSTLVEKSRIPPSGALHHQRRLPPPPVPQTATHLQPSQKPEIDPEPKDPPRKKHALLISPKDSGSDKDCSQYEALWSCSGDRDNELSFSKGDIIRVINKQYEGNGWLVAEINGKIGLVPKNYVKPCSS